MVLVGAFMALLDTTIVNVALRAIHTSLRASPASLEWMVSGYALAYGLVLVPAGRIGDRIGHKRQFIAGLALFTLASVACGISRTPDQIIAARVVQGFGAGVFYPAISATIQLAFTGPQRSKAFGTLGAVIGVSTALGPVLGGLIIQAGGAATAGGGYSWSTCSSERSRCRWPPGCCPGRRRAPGAGSTQPVSGCSPRACCCC